MIRIENLSFRRGSNIVLDEINLEIPQGGIIALVGPNGAGKSSLLSLMARLEPLQTGTVTIGGLSVQSAQSAELARKVAILRQDNLTATRLTVRELIGFGRFPHTRGRLVAEDHAIVAQCMAQFDLTDFHDRYIETLSGGQRQRVFVAMTLAQSTDYVFLDEPLNNLDMYHARELMRILRRIADESGKTIVIVLHDINHAGVHADRIIALKNGRVVGDGTPMAVLTSPTLESIFEFPIEVRLIDGRPFVLHYR